MFAVEMARDDFPVLHNTAGMAQFDEMRWRDPAAARENQLYDQGLLAAGAVFTDGRNVSGNASTRIRRSSSSSSNTAQGSPKEPRSPSTSTETIHSGHFMVSNPHKVKKSAAGYNFDNANKETAGSYQFGNEDAPIEIDSSFTKLFECMSLAYHECVIVSPKWKTFKGLKLSWKDKIRLNNAIWREWHNQFILGRKPLICQFSSPLVDASTYHSPQAVILEGKYWKRTLCAVVKEYQKWRIFYKKKLSSDVLDEDDLDDPWYPNGRQQQSSSVGKDLLGSEEGTPMIMDEEMLLSEFSDTLFTSLNPTFPFPNPREIAHAGMNADIIQPGLVQLQPSLDDVMDTFEPLPDIMKSISNSVPPNTFVFTGNQSQSQLLQQSAMNIDTSTIPSFQTQSIISTEEPVDGMPMDELSSLISGESNSMYQQDTLQQQLQSPQLQPQQQVQQQQVQQQQSMPAESSLPVFSPAGIQGETQPNLMNVIPGGLISDFGNANLILNQIQGASNQVGLAQVMQQNVISSLSQNTLEQLSGAMSGGGISLGSLQSNILLQQQLQQLQQMQQLQQQQQQQRLQQPQISQQAPQPQTEVINQYLPLQVQINQISPPFTVQQQAATENTIVQTSIGSGKLQNVAPMSLQSVSGLNQQLQQEPQRQQQHRTQQQQKQQQQRTVGGSMQRARSLSAGALQGSSKGQDSHVFQGSLADLLQSTQNVGTLSNDAVLQNALQQQQPRQQQQQQQSQQKQQQVPMPQPQEFASINDETQAKAQQLLHTLTSTLAQVQKQQQEQEARGCRGNLSITGLTPQQTQALKLLQKVANHVSASEMLQSTAQQSQQQQQQQQQPQQQLLSQQKQQRQQTARQQRSRQQKPQQQQPVQQPVPQPMQQTQHEAQQQPRVQGLIEARADSKPVIAQILGRNFIATTGLPQVAITTATTLQNQPTTLAQARFFSPQHLQQSAQQQQQQQQNQIRPLQTMQTIQISGGQPQIALATPITITSVQPQPSQEIPTTLDARPKTALKLQSRPKIVANSTIKTTALKSKQLIKPKIPAKIAPAPSLDPQPVIAKSPIVTSTATTSTALLTQLLAQGCEKYDTSPASISIRSDNSSCTPVRPLVLQSVKSEPRSTTKAPCTQASALTLALASPPQVVASVKPKVSGSPISMVTKDSSKPSAARSSATGFFTSAISSVFTSPVATTTTSSSASPVITIAAASISPPKPVSRPETPQETISKLPTFSISTSSGGLSPLGSPMSVVEEMDSMSDVNMSSKEEEKGGKLSHISAEQKRRVNIRSGFDQLHSMIPSLAQNPNAKISKANMLQKAVEYTKKLQADRKRMKDEIGVLRDEIAGLHADISDSQSQLPASGVPVTRQRVDMMRDVFDSYVRERTTQNWKFWIFSIIIRPLFESFNSTVSTSSHEELTLTVKSWLDQHCSLLTLRPTVLSSLTLLSRTTSILSDPTQMPQQAVEAVTRKDEEVD